MKTKMMKILSTVESEILESNDMNKLNDIRIKYLSKKGEISLLMLEIKGIPNAEKPIFGQHINDLKVAVEKLLLAKKSELENEQLLRRIASEAIDVTAPGYVFQSGSIHPLNMVIEDVEDFFIAQGFEVVTGPEVETDFYNFEMMNLPLGHPARAMQDSFYITEDLLLRTHTSPVQARTMLVKEGKPLKIICPGKTYRRDEDDATHSHQFMQIEGLVIEENVTFANLKATLLNLTKHLFGNDREIRLRPSYFPFTEPSVEVDVVFTKADGTKEYLEILGAGLVHPNVLKLAGYDSQKYSGFAFGVGVERIAMIKYDIKDIRHFYANDVRFLSQFKKGL